MAKYRQIQVTYWTDSFIIRLPLEKKLFYSYLLTNSSTTQCGIYEITTEQISFETGLTIVQVQEYLEYLERLGKIVYSPASSEILICNWPKYNYTNSIPVKTCVFNELKKVKDLSLITALYRTGTVPKGYGNPMVSTLQQEQEQEQEEKKEGEEEQKEKKIEVVEFLSEDEIFNIIEFIRITEKVNYSEGDINNYWQAFKIHSKGKPYTNHAERLEHFRNWLKRQPKPVKTQFEKHLEVNRKLKEMYRQEDLINRNLGKPDIPLSPI